jgi:hypothetical protein
MLPGGVVAEPQVLADWELDSITAAGVLVEVGSVAAALGDSGISRTDGRTFVFGGEHLDLGVGITVGEALACCGEDADVAVGSTVLGDGDIVRGATRTLKRDGPVFARGLSVGYLLAISYGRHFAARDQQLEVLDELRAALAAFRIDLPDAKSAAALVSDRWSDIMGIQ